MVRVMRALIHMDAMVVLALLVAGSVNLALLWTL